ARVSRIIDDESATIELESELTVLRNELQKENAFLQGIRFNDVNQLTPEGISIDHISQLRDHLDLLEEHYRKVYNQAESEKENAIYAMTRESNEEGQYELLFDNFKNDQLEVFATNRNDLNYIAEHNGQLIQKKDLIYLMPYNSDFFSAHFYAPAKKLFGNFVDTFFANLMVIWGMTILLILCLFFDVFPGMMRLMEDNVRLPRKK
ncbi:MAG TPA: hypothetical protein VJ949_06870, partial [Cryomorphaceae bacterium]|nr:hypothetical protein [Cryomorphaceae bacterium]